MIVIHDQSSPKSLAKAQLFMEVFHSTEQPLNVNLEQHCAIFTTSIKRSPFIKQTLGKVSKVSA